MARNRGKGSTKEKTIVISLTKGIKFHDGTDFNAEAVKWNIDQHLAVKGPGTEMLKSVDVLDAYTVRLNLLEWDNRVTSNLAAQLGMIISPTACKKNGKEWAAKHPVGTGPFEFVSWQKDVRTTYKKFPGYWQKGKPYLDRIEWNIIGETFTREAALRGGEIDVVLFPAPNDIAGLEKDGFVVSRHRITTGARGGVLTRPTRSPLSMISGSGRRPNTRWMWTPLQRQSTRARPKGPTNLTSKPIGATTRPCSATLTIRPKRSSFSAMPVIRTASRQSFYAGYCLWTKAFL